MGISTVILYTLYNLWIRDGIRHLLGGTGGIKLGRVGKLRLPWGGGWKVWWMIGLRVGFDRYERWWWVWYMRWAKQVSVVWWSGYDRIVTTRTQPCRYCPLWAQGALTALKRVYLVRRSLYIYSARNLLPYPMWDITNTLSCKHNVLVVSHGITGPNRQSQTNPHIGSQINFDTICNDPHTTM